MNMTMKEYDGMLAVACIVLAVVLNALQISYIADGLVMASHQDYIMASLMAIVISSGLFYSVFAGHRLWLKNMPRYYAWILGCLAGFLVGAMAAWSISSTAPVGSVRWWLGVLIGLTIPGQTIVLCNLTNGMLDLAGSGWWSRLMGRFILFDKPTLQKVQAVTPIAVPAVEPIAGPAPVSVFAQVETATVASIPIGTSEDLPAPEEVRAIPVVDPSRVPDKPPAQSIFSNGAIEISVQGDYISVRVGRQLTNRKWKLLHSDLRRVPLIAWDEAQKAKSAEGGADRTVKGVLRLPPTKGKRNRHKRRAARSQEMEAVIGRLKDLASEHSSS